MIIYDVHYQNNYPREIDSLHLTEEGAQKRIDELEGDWRMGRWEILGEDALRAELARVNKDNAYLHLRLETKTRQLEEAMEGLTTINNNWSWMGGEYFAKSSLARIAAIGRELDDNPNNSSEDVRGDNVP